MKETTHVDVCQFMSATPSHQDIEDRFPDTSIQDELPVLRSCYCKHSKAQLLIKVMVQVVEDVLEALHIDGSEAMPVPSSAYSSEASRPSKLPLRELLQNFYDLRCV